ncbi:hypothetical protein [Fredinandcohnia onubensis]|uniref:hypothetical protein n=1 Tax=Fredinandcohnia onubensis TaxID=1571209 RepID=UPI0015D4D4B9|nr:hypothetical protein [Fredinandcohnia onubensis]
MEVKGMLFKDGSYEETIIVTKKTPNEIRVMLNESGYSMLSRIGTKGVIERTV